MFTTYSERHNEYYPSEADDDARAERLRDALRLVETEAAELVLNLIVKHFPANLCTSDNEYVKARAAKSVAGYLFDMLGDVACDDELLALVDVE